MTSPPTAYPLAWPAGWPRTAAGDRQKGLYRTSLASSLKNLRGQLRLLGGDKAAASLILSSNMTLTRQPPADAGVVAFFVYGGQQVSIPCDRWLLVEHNVQAIALTIEAMRAMDRHGAKHMLKAMFQGFTALPAPDDWRTALGNLTTWTEVDAAYKERARSAHPDAGGSNERMMQLNAARDAARKELKA